MGDAGLAGSFQKMPEATEDGRLFTIPSRGIPRFGEGRQTLTVPNLGASLLTPVKGSLWQNAPLQPAALPPKRGKR